MAQNNQKEQTTSPYWGTNTKLVVGLAIVAVAGLLLAQLRPILTPIVMAVILSYLLFPLVEGLSKRTRLSWRGSVNLIYLVLLILLLSTLTATGLAIINQFESLVTIVETFLADLPTMVQNLIDNGLVITIPIFNYQFDVRDYIKSLNIDLLSLSEQALSAVQPFLKETGGLLAKIATSAFSILGWGGFILVISYLTLGEARQGRRFLSEELTNMTYDLERGGRELSHIWNAFLRGQVAVFFLSAFTMFILLSILGVRYALGLAVLAGLARFIPYIGQTLSAIVNALVAFFLAEGNYLGLDPLPYMLLVVACAFIHDQFYDSVAIPRLIGSALGVHPALVLIVALIATRFIGVLGLLLAAPVLASAQLIIRYLARKMLDKDPWPEPERDPKANRVELLNMLKSLWARVVGTTTRLKSIFQRKTKNE